MEETIIASAGMEENISIPLTLAGISEAEIKLTDLNTVTQQVFASIIEEAIQSKVILRCDVLPQVQANELGMLRVFQQIVNMILCCPLPDSKLFIYIKSSIAPNDIIDLSMPAGFSMMQISICTNSAAGACWEADNSPALEECNQICAEHGGSFLYNPANQSSALFTLHLPGKLNVANLG